MKALVLGNTALGVTIASKLSHYSGLETYLVGRQRNASSICLFEGWGRKSSLRVRSLKDQELSGIKLIFVTFEPFDLIGALRRYLPYLGRGSVLICITDGCAEDLIRKMASERKSYHWRIGYCTSTVREIGVNIFELIQPGMIYWGPVEAHQFIIQEEQALVETSKDFFKWCPKIIPSFRVVWLYNTVLHGLCLAKGYRLHHELFTDTKALQAVFSEAYRLGEEVWGPWPSERDTLFDRFISVAAKYAREENKQMNMLLSGRRVYDKYLVGKVGSKRGYPLLTVLQEQIREQKKKHYRAIR